MDAATVAHVRRLEAFHMRCLQQLLNITWQDHITNEAILATTGLTPLQYILSKQRSSLFGNITRLNPAVPVHQVLWTFPPVGSPTLDGDGPLVNYERPDAPRSGLMSECLLITTVSTVATAEWRNSPQGLRDDDADDDDDDAHVKCVCTTKLRKITTKNVICRWVFVRE